MRTLIATLIALMLFATTPAAAGGFEDGLAAYRAGDYQKAVGLWKQSAEQGNVRAQYFLGVMYKTGKGVPKDDFKAVHWYTKAAKQGDVRAQSVVAVRYATGKGVPQDDARAVYCYTKAAKQGNRHAQYQLGYRYSRGKGIPEDVVHGYAWLSIAAAQGSVAAPINKEVAANRMTPTQIAEAQKLSRELWEKYVVPFQQK